MSYYAKISFKYMNSQDIIPFLKKFKETYIKRIPEVAKENYVFCPVIRKNLNFPNSLSELHKDKFEILNCLSWVKDCSRFKYFYDDKFALLGVVGVPDCLNDLFDASIAFQNSGDQDYEQDAWCGIKDFEDIYAKWIAKDDNKVIDWYNAKHDFSFDKDYSEPIEKSEGLIYWRKAFAYQEIWERYENEIFDDTNAIYFSLFGAYESSELYKILRFCLTEGNKKLKEWEK